ncbi:hypothetical protein [Pseudomonas plecoglossicida]|uniref:hypothetical protein n=1 Tax=Pseudomonas plecoglossicida TaxID=70775 RepID=UPI0015E45AA6|nr:hypothetical protein [Pseudomonas plecoglossicida]MBA1321224.1 hypothetical protein [Pseudomonas plecoglossicida]
MSPFRLRAKTALSFSGGRTSAYMLRQERSTESTGQFAGEGARFRKDCPSYQQMIACAETQFDLFTEIDEGSTASAGD